jgi:hypothetical protein
MSVSVDSTVSALTLFPGWEDIGPWYRAEVHGLTEAQLDFAVPPPAPEWLWWSIRRHTSHTARVVMKWTRPLCGSAAMRQNDFKTSEIYGATGGESHAEA